MPVIGWDFKLPPDENVEINFGAGEITVEMEYVNYPLLNELFGLHVPRDVHIEFKGPMKGKYTGRRIYRIKRRRDGSFHRQRGQSFWRPRTPYVLKNATIEIKE